MQKLDFTESLITLSTELKSTEIVTSINQLPALQPLKSVGNLVPLIVQSKSKFDSLIQNPQLAEILVSIEAGNIYGQDEIGNLVSALSTVMVQGQVKSQLFTQHPTIINFYSFHKSLIAATRLSTSVLSKKALEEVTIEEVTIFRILSEEEGLELKDFGKILSVLEELIKLLQAILLEEPTEVRIVLLDTGSDTNFGVKTSVTVAKSLFQIFKEIWDWFVNRKFYNNKMRNEALLENLNVLKVIKKSQADGILSDEKAKAYEELLINKTDELVGLNVIPKQLFDLKIETSPQKLISEFKKTKLIENEIKPDRLNPNSEE